MSVERWEDDAVVWSGPHFGEEILKYDSSVETGYVSGRIITCVEVVDWTGSGSKDLLLSSWDTCYDGRVYLRRQIGTKDDGTPILGKEELVEGVQGYVTSFRDGDLFHLVSASRMRKSIYIYPNIGTPGDPKFGEPVKLYLDADWVKGDEYYHLARFVDIDGDDRLELVVGTDSWGDYWPNGLEWNDAGYKAYDVAGRWLGGPLRGFLYRFDNNGTAFQPKLGKGRPILAGEIPLQVYGQLAPAFGDFTGTTNPDIVCGEFSNILQIASSRQNADTPDGDFNNPKLVAGKTGETIELDHCIHLPCAVDWDDDGHLDLLVGAEDGYVTFLKNTGIAENGLPAFENMGRVETTEPIIHAGVLPSPAIFKNEGKTSPDLIVGNCSGELLFYESTGLEKFPTLLREHRLKSGGEVIRVRAGLSGSIQGPSEKQFGYTCPVVVDWTGNGTPDVLMSDVLGRHMLLENETGAYPPEFKAMQSLTYEGKPLKTVWRVRPAVVNWCGGDQLHYIALDDEGYLSDWQKLTSTELANKRHLHWENGDVVSFTQDVGGGLGRVKLCIADWNASGTYDLIVGTHARASMPPGHTGKPRHSTGQAGIFYLKNVGSNDAPVFKFPQPFKYKGQFISMGMHAVSPEAADWDGSGQLGLIAGAEDGSMVWFARKHLSLGDE